MMSFRFVLGLFPLITLVGAFGQTAAIGADGGAPSFHSRVPVVLVDAVVTNNRGEPVVGLKQADFQVFEDGKQQTLASFAEHKNRSPTLVQLPPMPPDVFTNFPSVISADSLNVLLVDGLNTQMRDQSYVHKELLKYLKSIPPNARVAVFILTSRLRMLQGFTSDSSALLAAVNSQRTMAASPLLQSEGEKQAEAQFAEFLAAEGMSPLPPQSLAARMIDPAEVLQQAFSELEVRLSETRMRMTLAAMQELARYLTPFPGRKNLLWLSGAFPAFILSDANLADPFHSSTQFEEEIQETAAFMTDARVAIYPIAAQGLMVNAAYQANLGGIMGTRPTGAAQARQLRSELDQNQSLHQAMEELAKDTGGEAFYEINGIGEALTRVTNSSANYYTLSYTTNRRMDGKYRRISLKLVSGKERLFYRRGYFAVTDDSHPKERRPDSLSSLFAFGMPDLSQIVYKVRVIASEMQDGSERTNGSVPVKTPGTTYTIEFAISLDDLKLDLTPDGIRQGKIQLKVVAYDTSGKLLNTVGGDFALSIKPENFAVLQRVGLQIRQKIDVPGNERVQLYSGVRDLNTSRIGTLGIEVRGAGAGSVLRKSSQKP